MFVSFALVFISLLIAFTPVGYWVFKFIIFGASTNILNETQQVYQVLVFLCLITTFRNIYQAVIINHLRTVLMTIGTIVRIVFMGAMANIFIQFGWTDARIGAMIFLTGLLIEALITAWEGRGIVSTLPTKKVHQGCTFFVEIS